MANARTTAWSILVFLMASFALFPACSADKGDSLTRVKKAGQILFAMSTGYAPFSFYNDKKELVGFDVDVAHEVAKRLGVELKIVITPWSGIIDGLQSKAYDGILGSMAVTEDRLKVVNFSIAYYYSGAQLMVRKDAPFKSPSDLKGATIGIEAGTTYEKDAEVLGAGDIRLYHDSYKALVDLQKGVLDGSITDKVAGIYAMNVGKLEIKPLGASLRNETIAVAFRKEDDTLLKEVNKILKAMHRDGTLNALIKKVAGGEYNVSAHSSAAGKGSLDAT
jgi:polar amino acid transport system substrate-binding protein